MKVAFDRNLRPGQTGFRAHRSCKDNIVTMRIIEEWSIKFQANLYIKSTDFETAFDSVHRETVGKILKHLESLNILCMCTKFTKTIIVHLI